LSAADIGQRPAETVSIQRIPASLSLTQNLSSAEFPRRRARQFSGQYAKLADHLHDLLQLINHMDH
jgi:hypothetical protein